MPQIVFSRDMRILLLFCLILAAFTGYSQTNYRTNGTGGGNWNTIGTWQVETVNGGGNWIAAAITPSSASNNIQIRANDVVNVTANLTIDQTTIDPNGTVQVNSGITLTIANGAGVDLTSAGTLRVNGTLNRSGTSGLQVTFNGGSLINNSTINLATGTGSSTITFTGGTSLSTTGTPTLTSLYNVTINSGVTVTSGISFNIVALGTLSVSGVLTANAGFDVAANGNVSVTGSGSIAANGAFSIVGTLSVATGGTFTATAAGNIGGNFGVTGSYSTSALTTFNGSTIVTGTGTKSFQNVLITGSVSATANTTLSVSGNLTVNGSINFTSGTWSLSGSSNFIQTSGGSPSIAFYNLTIASGASITATTTFAALGNVSIAGTFIANADFTTGVDLTLTSTGTLQANNNFSVGGLTSISGTATINAGFGTLDLTVTTATGVLTTNNDPFNVDGNTTVSAGGHVTTNAGFSAQGAVTVTGSGSQFNVVGNSFSIGGTLSPTASGQFIADSNSTGSLLGNLAGTGVFTSSGIISFDGTSLISGTGTKTFNDLNISATGAVTSSGNIVQVVNGNFVNDGNYTLTSGGTTFNGSSKSIGGSVSPTFFNTTIGSGATIASSIAFTAGGTLTIASTATLTTAATFTATGAVTATGTLISNAGFTASGAVTVTATTGSITANNSPFTIGGALAVNGTMTANAGADMTLTSTTGNNFSVNATTGNFTSLATVYFNGITIMTTNGTRVFRDIYVNAGHELRCTGTVNFTVNNSVTNDGGSINLAGGTLTFPQNASIVGLGTPVLTTFFNVIIGTGTTLTVATYPTLITVSSDLTLNGNLNHTATNTISMGDDLLGTTGTLSSLGTIRFMGTASASVVGAAKNFTNLTVGDGVIASVLSVGANSSFTIDGALNVLMGARLNAGTGTSVVTFGNAFAGTTPSITGPGTINFDGLTITSAHTLTITGTTSINLTADFVNNGSLVANQSLVSFSTAGTKLISGNAATFNSITVGNGTGNTVVTNSMSTLSMTGRLTLTTSTAAINTFNTNNNLILLSTADEPANDASIGPLRGTSAAVLNGQYTAQRYMSSESRIWRYIAAPVVGATVATLKNAFPVSGTFSDPTPAGCAQCGGTPAYVQTSPSLYSFNEATNAYVAYPTTSSAAALTNTRGYSVYVRQDGLTGPATINFKGTHPTTPVGGLVLPVANVVDRASLVGNPYPSPIIWDPTNSTMYPGTTGVYSTAKVRNNGTGGPVFVDVLPGGTIAAGQAFWVTSSSASAALRISESAKTSSTSTSFYRTNEIEQDELVITMTKTSTGVSDIAKVKIQSGSNASLYIGGNFSTPDSFDAYKWDNAIQGSPSINVFDLSTLSADNYPLSTNSVPSLGCSQQINLKIADLLYSPTGMAEATANYQISFNPAGALKNLTWTLHDNALGTNTNVSNGGTYSFSVDNSNAATKAADRFYVTISSSTTINSSTPISTSASTCDGAGAMITVQGSQTGVTYGAEVNGVMHANIAQGNGSGLVIDLDDEWLASGNNAIKVIANTGCSQQYLTTTLSVQKNSPYEISSASGVTLCKVQPATLTASSAQTDATFRWYDNELVGNVLATDAQFITPAISTNKTYYVAAVSPSGCEGKRVAVSIVLSDSSPDIEIVKSSDVLCKGGVMTFTVSTSLSGGSFNWYDSPTAVAPLSTNSEFTTTSLTNSKSYFVSYTNENGCEGARKEVVAMVSDFAPVLSGSTQKALACLGSQHVLIANTTDDVVDYRWYESATSTSPVGDSKEWSTPALSLTRQYYLSAINKYGCESARVPVLAKVESTDPSAGISPAVTTACQNEDTFIRINNGSDSRTYNWFTNSSDAFPAAQGTVTSWSNIGYSSGYYVEAINNNGCIGSRKQFTMNIISYADARIDSVSDGQLISNFDSNNNWYFNDELISTKKSLTAQNTGLYTLKVMVDGKCETSTARQVNVNVTTGIGELLNGGYVVYPNPTSDYLHVSFVHETKIDTELVDANGRVVRVIEMKNVGNNEWSGVEDLRALARGMYFVRVKTNQAVTIRKIILK